MYSPDSYRIVGMVKPGDTFSIIFSLSSSLTAEGTSGFSVSLNAVEDCVLTFELLFRWLTLRFVRDVDEALRRELELTYLRIWRFAKTANLARPHMIT